MDMPFFPTTIADILAGFEATIERLDKLIARNETDASRNRGRVETLIAKNAVLLGDAQRAITVSNKLRALISE